MIESITIKNVGALRNVHIPEIKPLTVLIGNSASGKSTLMKIIALMRYVFKRLSIRAYIKNADIDKTVFYIRFRDLLRDGMDKIVDERSFIKDLSRNQMLFFKSSDNIGKFTIRPHSLDVYCFHLVI